MKHKILMAQSLRRGIELIRRYRVDRIAQSEFLYAPWLSVMFRVSGEELTAEEYEQFALKRREACEARNDWNASLLRAKLKWEIRKQEVA